MPVHQLALNQTTATSVLRSFINQYQQIKTYPEYYHSCLYRYLPASSHDTDSSTAALAQYQPSLALISTSYIISSSVCRHKICNSSSSASQLQSYSSSTSRLQSFLSLSGMVYDQNSHQTLIQCNSIHSNANSRHISSRNISICISNAKPLASVYDLTCFDI